MHGSAERGSQRRNRVHGYFGRTNWRSGPRPWREAWPRQVGPGAHVRPLASSLRNCAQIPSGQRIVSVPDETTPSILRSPIRVALTLSCGSNSHIVFQYHSRESSPHATNRPEYTEIASDGLGEPSSKRKTRTTILRAVNRGSNVCRGPGHYNVRTRRIKLTASGSRNIAKRGFSFAFSILWVDGEKTKRRHLWRDFPQVLHFLWFLPLTARLS
jgi:hypothetical protein